MNAYRELPNTQTKALGAMNTNRPFPGSLDLIQCKDGQDTIVQDYTKVAGWENPEVLEVIGRIESALKEEPSTPEIHAENFRIIQHIVFLIIMLLFKFFAIIAQIISQRCSLNNHP